MEDRKIFECMARIQGIRAVQISDMLDVELAEVSAALKDLFESGDITRRSGFAPNGVAAQCYDFSDYFKTTNDYKAVMASLVASGDAPAASPAPATPVNAVEPLSRAERAIAFIKLHGSATDTELREYLVMRQEEYPSSVLTHAVKAGRVTRRNNRWVPGDGRPVMDPPASPAFGRISLKGSTPTPVPSVKPFLADRVEPPVKPSGVKKPKSAPAPVSTDPAAGATHPASDIEPARAYRCAIWSDGMVELQANGRTVAMLARVEAEFIAGFMAQQVAA